MHDINSKKSIPNETTDFRYSKNINNNDENPSETFNSLFDTNKNGIVEIKEQKAGIFDKINILTQSDVTDCFGNDIKYDRTNETEVKNVDSIVQQRRETAIKLAESKDYINKKILDKGSTVFYEKNDPTKEVMGYSNIDGEKQEFQTEYKKDGSYYRFYSDESVRYYNPAGKWVHGINAHGEKYSVSTNNKNGNYTLDYRNPLIGGKVEVYSKDGDLISVKNYTETKLSSSYNTRQQSYKLNLQDGISMNTGGVNPNTLKGDVNINREIEPVKQGNLGDCYFLSQINALSGTEFGKTAIKNSIKDNQDGTYTVSLKGAGKEYTVSKQEILYAKSLTTDGDKVYSQGDDDVVLLEIAFEKYYTDIQGYADNNFINKSGTDLIKVKNQKGEIFENRAPFSYGGYGGDFGRANTNSDFAKLLTGENSFSGFDLNSDNPQATEMILKQKALHPNDVAITYSTGPFKDEYDYDDVPKKYEDAQSENHQLSIAAVTLDENKNIKTVKVINSWNSKQVTEVPYKDFLKLISLTKQNNIWIASNNQEVNKSINEFTDNEAKEIAEKLKQQENSGDFFRLLNNDDYALRPKIVKHYGGMQKLVNDIMQKTPDEWSNSTRHNKPTTLEEYQQGVMDVFIQASGLFKNITTEEYFGILANRDEGLRSYCLRHGLVY